MLERRIVSDDPKGLLPSRLSAYPAVAMVGPRQCGKTTLARSLGGRYYDMEQETDKLRLDLEWSDAVAGEEIVIVDEAQEAPEIFPRLRGAIDADRRRNGRFLLLGSISPALMRNVSESLAGRLSVVELAPLSWLELPADAQARLWRCGGYPDGGVLDGQGFPQWQHDYLDLLAQRDLPSWGLPASAPTTRRLFGLLAARHGQQWNASDVGRGLSLSYHTVNAYLDYLEGAFLVRRLPAYHASLGKQLTKKPKVYWRDSGLLHCLLGLSRRDDQVTLSAAGASWEGHVIDQLLTALHLAGRRFDAWHLRTADGREIDLVLRVDTELWAVEVKLTTSPGRAQMARLNESADLIGADRRFLVTRQPEAFSSGTHTACNLAGIIAATRTSGA
ncbi:MAG: ATP-binding protein [Acidimicrobiaceae bacterium]|nr:ATP-binding protein [Acidimicrobiaceae bacterium]MXZ99010.1 ATP-binding protein [Acidimicrobiaceae bacterium]MYE75387.1 ATP-binding protein [Acidimicrobiaceae bacterium]MYE96225.1 ATP-binding protein [Acidimicrobiaceae bacterium]MYH43598.1 ATP-binding protein [Acidimicrobiaceae bacterium]